MRGLRREKISLILAIFLVFSAKNVFAQMSSTNYQINWDGISSGGGQGTSASYTERGSVSEANGQASSSSSYSISQGFRAGIYDPVVAFAPYIQDRSTQVAAVGFSEAVLPPSVSVDVTTTTGFSVGDTILIVQDEGAAQVSLMARVSSIQNLPPRLELFTNYAGSAPTIDGTNDYVYRMTSSASIDFGSLTSSSVTTHTIGWGATADVTQGYFVYLFADGALLSGSDTIAAVADGSVTAGSSEYGGRSSDTSLSTSTFDTADTAITTDPALVGSVSANPFSSLGFVTLKVAISSTQAQGSYSQTLTTIFVGDY